MSLTESLAAPPQKDASDVLREVAGAVGADGIQLKAALAGADKRGFALFFLFAFVLLLLPIDIVLPQIAGLTLLVCGFGMMGGAAAPWLPGFIGKRTLKKESVVGLAQMFEGMAWSKLVLSPRAPWLVGDKLIGFVVLLVGIVVASPGLPDLIPALAMLALALGLMQRDGLVMLIGLATAIGWLAFIGAMVAGYFTQQPYAVGWVSDHIAWLSQIAIPGQDAAPN